MIVSAVEKKNDEDKKYEQNYTINVESYPFFK